MITPEWVTDEEYQSIPNEVREAHAQGSTVFYLPLSDPGCVVDIAAEMQVIREDAAQLFSLRRIRESRFCVKK